METISDIAARWAVRTDAGELPPEQQRELDQWLSADARHRGAYVRARARWDDLNRLAALNGPALPENTTTAADQKAARRFSAPSRRQLLAAGIAALCIAAGAWSWRFALSGQQHYVSAIGEVRRIALAEGSTLVLNTNTEVLVRLSATRRDVQLLRGEALFEVAHDRARPFVVKVNDTAVRAVGTAFTVRLDTDNVKIVVSQGVVEVSNAATRTSGDAADAASRTGALRRVSANERLVVSPRQLSDVQPLAAADVSRLLSWRDGMVSFDGESLLAATSEINRHNRKQILVSDRELAGKPVVGVFSATDPDGFSAAAAAALRAHAVADADVIRLEPGTANSASQPNNRPSN